uniref:Uncharacterized protein n=1 Tax=Noccaea caerulescens TaxID=107243 RepID=A0A1J3FP35_NOCCA
MYTYLAFFSILYSSLLHSYHTTSSRFTSICIHFPHFVAFALALHVSSHLELLSGIFGALEDALKMEDNCLIKK